jgi:hypothetical protein
VVGITQKDEPKYGHGVFRGLKLGIGPQFIRRGPETGFDVVSVMIHGLSLGRFLLTI